MTARTWRPNGPGSFQAPADVIAVQDRTGRRWTRNGPRWTCTGSHWIRWRSLIAEHGPVTEEAPKPTPLQHAPEKGAP